MALLALLLSIAGGFPWFLGGIGLGLASTGLALFARLEARRRRTGGRPASSRVATAGLIMGLLSLAAGLSAYGLASYLLDRAASAFEEAAARPVDDARSPNASRGAAPVP
jgi:hypothetical protein